MTGAGVAFDSASRGLKVALIDAGDFASGTSSKSSKMVHGGLRYLQQKEFRLVYENLRERQRLLENAPFLVRPLPFLIPLFGNNGVASKAIVRGYATALRIYDLTGGWRIGKRFRKLTKNEALGFFPSLNSERLVAGFLYFDARGDDARVALTLARSAALDFDADVANYVRALDVVHGPDGLVKGLLCRDERDASTFTVSAKTVVNATGVWADEIFTMAEDKTSHRITPAKGVHVTVPRSRLDAKVAAVLSVPGDRRSIFIVPFEDAPYTFIGTTDTAYDGSLDTPECTPEDVAYLLNAVNASTSSDLKPDDVTGLWAGLRPLLSPKDGHRMSERTADLSRRHRVTDTKDGVVHQRYGSESTRLLSLVRDDPSLADIAIPGQSYILAEFLYGAQQEMATSLIDLVTRRTRAHLHDARSTLESAPAIVDLVARELKWDHAECARQLEDYRALVSHEFASAGLRL